MVNQMVLSEEIEWIGYDEITRNLRVEFIEGPIHQYSEVPLTIYEAFLAAESHDSFFERYIQGRYSHCRVR